MGKEFKKKADLKGNYESEKKESEKKDSEQIQNAQTENVQTKQTETGNTKAEQTKTEQERVKQSETNQSETGQDEQTDQTCRQELLQKISDLEAQKAELEDMMLRQRAELENFRKRLIREKEDAVTFANTALIKELLQFLDNLERTIEATKKSSDVKALSDGVQMTRDQLLSALEKNWGLEKIDPKNGEEFLPAEHEACMAQTVQDIETESVLEVLQAGYKLHSRVLRPAKVKIAKPE